ncbi:UNVERIFIED_CONTAM: hypothetical protein Slati_1474900 [Sesamum latifolium]|uniref:Retrotransposon gag domain-containing protein n=1 Tax=Sesamum latifolium TaxID=2727402 RepID=A0AAW2X522_9LAMI
MDVAKEEDEKKGLLEVQYQIVGAPSRKQQGVPFTKRVMADELPVNCRTPIIAEYDGTTDSQEHLLHFENFASSRKHRNTKLSLFAVRQKEGELLKEYLQRFNTAALEVPSATEEVKSSAFSYGLLDGDFFKSLAKKPISKFDASWPELRNISIWRMLKPPRGRVGERKGRKRRRRSPLRSGKLIFETKYHFYRKDDPSRPKSDKEYVCWEKARGREPYQKLEPDKTKAVKDSSPEALPKEAPKSTPGGRFETNNPPCNGVIRMIAGGTVGGDLDHARKAHDIPLKEVLDVDARKTLPSFNLGERRGLGPGALIMTPWSSQSYGPTMKQSGAPSGYDLAPSDLRDRASTENLLIEIPGGGYTLDLQCHLGEPMLNVFSGHDIYLAYEN